MRVLLVQPEDPPMLVGFPRLARAEPLALEILAATIPDHQVNILDLRVDPSLERPLQDFAPNLVGVTGYTTSVPHILSICRQVKAAH